MPRGPAARFVRPAMTAAARRFRFLLLALGGALASALSAQMMRPGPDPANPAAWAAVVYNAVDPLAEPLARFYAEKRGIPADRIVSVRCPLTEEISREEYDRTIAAPLRKIFDEKKWWDRTPDRPDRNPTSEVRANRIRYLVLVRGLPLKIAPAAGPIPGDDPPPKLPDPLRVNAAAVDSELAVLAAFARNITGFLPNPYFRSFARITEVPLAQVMLVGRLDGPSDGLVRRMIEDSLLAERDGLWGRAYFDSRGLPPGTTALAEGDGWLVNARKECDLPLTWDDREAMFENGFPMREAALYLGWYAGGIAGPFNQPDFRFERGAVAVHIHSFSASTLRDPNAGWAAPLLARGAAATLGNVYEPYLHFTVHLDVFHSRLSNGFTLGEACYMALPGLSWMNTLVGDPLYRPFKVPQDLGLRASMGIASEAELTGGPPLTEEMRAFSTLARQRRGKSWNAVESDLVKAARRLKSARIWEGLAGLQWAQNDVTSAVRSWDTAREIYSSLADQQRCALQQARALISANRKPAALALARAMLAKHGASPAAECFRALENEIEPPPPAPK